MRRRLLVLLLLVAVGTSCTVASPPEVRCTYLAADPCLTGALAIDANLGHAHPIQRIGLYGYGGCFGYCPLFQPPPERLDALAAVVFADGSPDAVVTIAGLDGGPVSLVPTEGLTSAQVLAMAGYER